PVLCSLQGEPFIFLSSMTQGCPSDIGNLTCFNAKVNSRRKLSLSFTTPALSVTEWIAPGNCFNTWKESLVDSR
ncbi:MAG: hypothetical protein JWM16_343, partial [Verrucomicrobiales bacterium]|nr:hypothetical protein [Verrucomicrobiales bacterium]